MYILCKKFNEKSISGFINLSVDTECEVIDNIIHYNNKPICYITSQNAYDYFSNNEDGKGKQRFKLIGKIKDELKRLNNEYSDKVAGLLKDCETEEEVQSALANIEPIETNITLNYEFYNKPINELQSIYDKIKEEKYE